MPFFPHFASYCEFTTKKEQDNGCNRSSKKVNLKCSDLTLCWKRTHQEHVCLALPLFPLGVFGRRQQMDLKELNHPNQSMTRDPLLSYDLRSKRTQTFKKMTHLIATFAAEFFRTLREKW